MCGCQKKSIGMAKKSYKPSSQFIGVFAATIVATSAAEASNLLLDKVEALQTHPWAKGLIKLAIGTGVAYWGDQKQNEYIQAAGLGFATNGASDLVKTMLPEPDATRYGASNKPDPGSPNTAGIGNTLRWTDEMHEANTMIIGNPGEDGIGKNNGTEENPLG
jgi:hypothetical protein